MTIETTLILEQAFSSERYPVGPYISPDGTRLFVSSNYNWTMSQYSLSTPWDLSTAVIIGSPITLTDYTRDPTVIYATEDGINLFLGGKVSGKYLTHYTLATPWNLTTKVFVRRYNYTTLLSNLSIRGIAFSDDGSKMFVSAANDSEGYIHEIALGTAWDISTPTLTQTYDLITELCSGTYRYPIGVWFSDGGGKFFTVAYCNFDGKFICTGTLATPWDISSVTLDTSEALGANVQGIGGLFVSPTESNLFIAYSYAGLSTLPTINQYQLTAGLPSVFWTNFSGQRELL